MWHRQWKVQEENNEVGTKENDYGNGLGGKRSRIQTNIERKTLVAHAQ